MRTLIFLLAISRLTTSSLLPYHGVTIGITPYSAPVNSQYHTQDKYGQYVYGYASGLSAKDEIKTADGITRGGYSYIDANGILQTVQYVSDPINGFRVSASNIPRDLPEVALAKAQHYQAYENIKAEHAYISAIQASSPVVAISPFPATGTVVVPISAAKVAPVAYIPSTVQYSSVPISNQYHAQDKLGQYAYGYAGPLSSKSETKTADGVTRGGYSYIDANGNLQNVQYISDPVNGFRVQATNLPEAPSVTLIGPKVTTSVVGPKDNTAILTQPEIKTVVANPPLNVIPLASSPQLQNIPVDYNPGYQGEFVNPVIVHQEGVHNGNQAVFTNPPVLTEVNHQIIQNGNSPVLTNPVGLTNPIHNVPFPSNGQILTHSNLANNQVHQPIQFDNLGAQHHILQHQLIVPHSAPPNLGFQPQNPQVYTDVQSHTINNEAQQPIQIENHGSHHTLQQDPVHQLILQNSPPPNLQFQPQNPQVYTDIQTHPNDGISNLNGQVFVNRLPEQNQGYEAQNLQVPINNPPNYQIPINPAHAVASDGVISKDLINSAAINQGSGLIYQQNPVGHGGAGSFLQQEQRLGEAVDINFEGNRAAGPAYGGVEVGPTLDGGQALFIPRHHIQQVQQTPVSAVEQQASLYQEHEARTLDIRQDKGAAGPAIQGPSGAYTQNIQY